jgi:site-specific recombinase XerD
MKTAIKKDNYISEFFDKLNRVGISALSIKNYRSDVYHFVGWLIFSVRSLGVAVDSFSECTPFIQPQMGIRYKKFLVENRLSSKTVNRRLTTLRHLSRFLNDKHIITFDFTQDVSNIETGSKTNIPADKALLMDFEKYLSLQTESKNTIKNYLSDIKHFLSWLQQNQLETSNN